MGLIIGIIELSRVELWRHWQDYARCIVGKWKQDGNKVIDILPLEVILPCFWIIKRFELTMREINLRKAADANTRVGNISNKTESEVCIYTFLICVIYRTDVLD